MNEELIQFFQEVKFTLETRKERLVDRKIQKIKREGAVLVPLIVMPSVKKIEEIYLILVKRSNQMRNNPGDMAFPGGIADKGETPKETALREATEEIGINGDEVEILGLMDEFVSQSNTLVRAVIGKLELQRNMDLQELFDPKTKENTVTLAIPLEHFLNKNNYYSEPYLKQLNGKVKKGYIRYFDINDYLPGEKVWGLTATIIRRFLDLHFNHDLPEEPLY